MPGNPGKTPHRNPRRAHWQPRVESVIAFGNFCWCDADFLQEQELHPPWVKQNAIGRFLNCTAAKKSTVI
jgi:hypothetical protein